MRLTSVDVTRGIAVLGMVHIHVVHAFVTPALRKSWPYEWSCFIGGLAAPGFLTLAGLSAVIVAQRQGRLAVILRGLQVWWLALAFRIFEWAMGGEGARSSDILRVDVLNCIGVSLALVGLCLPTSPTSAPSRARTLAFLGTLFFVATPFVRGTTIPLPDPVRYYLADPSKAPFALFGWAGYAFFGAALGLTAADDRALTRRGWVALPLYLVLRGIRELFGAQLGINTSDFDPVFPFERLALTVALFGLTPLLTHGPTVKLLRFWGRHSLLIYWVHVELAYGLTLYRWHDRLTWPLALLMTIALLAVTSGLGWLSERLLQWRGPWARPSVPSAS